MICTWVHMLHVTLPVQALLSLFHAESVQKWVERGPGKIGSPYSLPGNRARASLLCNRTPRYPIGKVVPQGAQGCALSMKPAE